MRGVGRVGFVAVLLFLAGAINILYGFGALDGARVFVGDTRYLLTNLNALGWVLIILGLIQLTGGASLMSGSAYGRVIGVLAASLGATVDRRSLPMVVARRFLPLHLHRPRHLAVRRRRESHRGSDEDAGRVSDRR